MEKIQMVTAILPRVDRKSLISLFNENPDILHRSDTTRYLIRVQDAYAMERPSWKNFRWLKPRRYRVAIHLTDYRRLDEVSVVALHTALNGGDCYIARTNELLDGELSFTPFWPVFLEFMVQKATDNPTRPVKALASMTVFIIIELSKLRKRDSR